MKYEFLRPGCEPVRPMSRSTIAFAEIAIRRRLPCSAESMHDGTQRVPCPPSTGRIGRSGEAISSGLHAEFGTSTADDAWGSHVLGNAGGSLVPSS